MTNLEYIIASSRIYRFPPLQTPPHCVYRGDFRGETTTDDAAIIKEVEWLRKTNTQIKEG